MKKCALILMLYYWFPIQKSHAQDFPKFTFSHINNHNQIPNDACSNIYKDSKGFLWISTMEGFCRYDGKNTTVFNYEYNNPNSIANGNVQAAAEDNDGNIWVSQSRGISRLSSTTGKIFNYFHKNNDSKTVLGNYSMVRTDKDGNVFNTDREGYQLKYFEKRSARFLSIHMDTTNDGFNNKDESNDLIGTLSAPQHDNSMYLLSKNGIFLFDTKKFTRKRVCNSSAYQPLCIFKDHAGKLWLGEWMGGLSLINEITKAKQNIIPDEKVSSITEYQDKNGKYWILACESKTGSIIILDPATGKYYFQLLKIENEVTVNLIPRMIYCDPNGSIYVASAAGLLVSKPISRSITNIYTYERGKPADIAFDNLVYGGSMLTNGGYLFGMFRYNGLRIYDSSFLLQKIIKTYNYSGKTYDLDVRSITAIAPGQYLLSGETGIAFMQKDVITPLQYVPKTEVNSDAVYSGVRNILPHTANEYWVRMLEGGIKIFNTVKKQFTKEYVFAVKSKKEPFNSVRNILHDKKGRLWVNNYFSIFLYDSIADEFKKQPINENSKYLSEMYSMCFDTEENIWIAGEEGLLKYNLITKKEDLFTTKNGLANNITSKALVDNENNIWVIHQTGLSMLDTKTYIFKNYNKNDGLPMFYTQPDGISFFDNKNDLIIGNDGVITIIDIDQLRKIKPPLCKIVITQVQGIDSSITIQSNHINEKQVTLTHENFPANILFSIIDYSTNAKRKYYYRYTGKDTSWIECKDGVVPINTIVPGDYTIEVTGKVNNADAGNIDRIKFSILPKWYQSRLFKFICLLSAILAIYLFIKWRVRSVKAAATLKQQITETEMAALKAQMNPHFMFNCINSIDAFIHNNDKYNATLYLNKFAKLLRNILDSSKQNTVAFTKDIETLKLYIELEELRNRNRFKTTINIDDELLGSDYKVPPLIIQPFVENAILHGLKNKDDNNGLLQIEIKKTADKIEYNIQDNGVGRKAAGEIAQNKEASYGIQLSYDRIRLFNKEEKASVKVIDLFNNGEANGTLIKVALKII